MADEEPEKVLDEAATPELDATIPEEGTDASVRAGLLLGLLEELSLCVLTCFSPTYPPTAGQEEEEEGQPDDLRQPRVWEKDWSKILLRRGEV